jgi:uncharacterized membrane protein YgcG
MSLELWVGVPVFLVVLVVGVVASLRMPIRTPVTPAAQALEELMRKGPDSYFHHIFDPDQLLGLAGQLDLDLDRFERETSHGVLLAALPHLPPEAPELALHAAELWRPGVAGADNGVVVFVFPSDRRVHVLVGYGLESVLPDAEVGRLVTETFLPAARTGDYLAGLNALVQPLFERLRTVPRVQAKPLRIRDLIRLAAQEIPCRARQVRAVWLGGQSHVRLLVSAAVALGVAILAVLIARLVHCGVLVGRRLSGGRGDLGLAAGELIASLIRLGQISAFALLFVAGSSLYLPGTGSFGGGGVDLLW